MVCVQPDHQLIDFSGGEAEAEFSDAVSEFDCGEFAGVVGVDAGENVFEGGWGGDELAFDLFDDVLRPF